MMKKFLVACVATLPVSARAETAPLRIARFASFPPMAYKIPEANGLAGVKKDCLVLRHSDFDSLATCG